MSSSHIEPRKLATFSFPEDLDFDPSDYATGFNTIASLASRCLNSRGGTVNHDLLWSIIKLSENYYRELSLVSEVQR
ncbi:hypothetical protein [Propionivibrio sp.]|uniref:hypothetical protein n=1 Tax=Propionivibrio sp. TaxID=2212460 RepID=UPI0039E2E440